MRKWKCGICGETFEISDKVVNSAPAPKISEKDPSLKQIRIAKGNSHTHVWAKHPKVGQTTKDGWRIEEVY